MATGIKIWDASGNLIFDETSRAGRVLGTTVVNGGSGSIPNGDFSQGTPWAIAFKLGTGLAGSGLICPCYTSFSGNTLNWAYGPVSGQSADYQTFIAYGVY